MSELVCLQLSIVLWIVHVLIQGALAGDALGLPYLFSARDQRREAKGAPYGRATRALANYVENLGPFVAADLGLIVTQHGGGLGATIWIIARIVYVPFYLGGIVYLRTAAWVVSLVGLIMMLVRLAS